MPRQSAVPGVGLVAILLVTRSRPGPRLVFHYPEEPISGAVDATHNDADGDISDGSNSSSSDDDDDDAVRISRTPVHARSTRFADIRELPPATAKRTRADSLLGHSTESLEKVLAPGRWANNQRFEVCIDGFTYLGHPVYIDGEDEEQEMNIDIDISTTTTTSSSIDSSSTSRSDKKTTTTTTTGISMFHIVLVLAPHKASEARLLHAQILVPLTAALRHLQTTTNYVAHESRHLLALQQKARQHNTVTSHQSLTDASSLARSLSEIYSQLTLGHVAEFRLDNLEMSLGTQSPTADSLTPHSALLLLVPAERLIAQDLSTKPEAAPLTHILPSLTPSKSLSVLSASLAVPLQSLLSLSHHLLLYRKALLLPAPLHWRNMYVVSPTAPVADLARHAEEYAALFPTLPSLPNMLKVLSGKVIRYGVLVPSRDHRQKYLQILSWLWKEGWVVQVRRWGWIRVPRYMLLPPRGKSTHAGEVAVSFDDDSGSVSSERTAIASTGNFVSQPPTNRRLSELLAERALFSSSNHTLPHRDRKRGSDVTMSSSSSSSPVAVDLNTMVLIPNPRSEPHLVSNLQHELFDADDDNNAEEKRNSHFQPHEELKEILAQILPFLDGEHAFENLAAEVGVKRSAVEKVLEALEGRGWILGWKGISS